MSYILVIFTVIGFQVNGNNGFSNPKHDWRAIGEFKNEAACVHAARQMGMNGGNRFRCLPTDTAQQKEQAK